jgi:hypothetical protein
MKDAGSVIGPNEAAYHKYIQDRNLKEGEEPTLADQPDDVEDELRGWRGQDMTRKLAAGLRARHEKVSGLLIQAAVQSSDPDVRGHAVRLVELHEQLKAITG